ncbi:MAG: hypothetical protein A2Z47_06155 [Thermodesulfovibrio sp. RBG_19FT_COMBO_42_12]|nr:MAG: hypothetical protein A2Z47_06155 [Thermodesulfovibrio sp. RBG_19FT_COMBO_42_12]
MAYQIQISNSTGFSTTIVETVITAATYTPTITFSAGTYYWRIRAADSYGNESAWSSTWSFTLTAINFVTGTIAFDYNNNNGRYNISYLDIAFDTAWSGGGLDAIYSYSDYIRSVALASNITDVSQITDASIYDQTSRFRLAKEGEILIIQNNAGYYAAIKINAVFNQAYGDSKTELQATYYILTDKSKDFSVIPDTTAPANTAAANFINSGASSTSSTSATLSISATDAVGVTAYYASETSTTPSATATGWVAVTAATNYTNTSVPFTLSSGDGTKTVYVWFKDAAGNVSAVASDSITLAVSGSSVDTTPPVLTSVTVTPATITGSGTVTIKVGLTESGSGVGYSYVSLYSPTKLSGGSGTELSESLTYNSTSGLYEGTVNIQNYHESGVWKVGYLYLSDLAGNTENYSITSSVSTVNYAYYSGTGYVDSGVAIQGVTKQ